MISSPPNPPSSQWAASQALLQAPGMAQLAARIRLSEDLLNAIQLQLPSGLRGLVQAGPITDSEWCLLLKSSAAAAKIRQLMPDIQAEVQRQLGRPMEIRLRVLPR